MVRYLENLGHVINRKVWWQVLKYILLDHDLYRWTINGLLLRCLGSDQSKVAMGEFVMKYALHISQLIWDDWLLWSAVFLSRLCWKIVLDTTKIVNHARKSKTCNWCLLPCFIPLLSEGCFVIGVYGQPYLAFCRGHWCILVATYPVRESLYSYVVQNMQLSRLPIAEGITKVFGKMHKSHYGR
jgi:hypothetical protein